MKYCEGSTCLWLKGGCRKTKGIICKFTFFLLYILADFYRKNCILCYAFQFVYPTNYVLTLILKWKKVLEH